MWSEKTMQCAGGFGRYQLRLMIVTFLIGLPQGFYNMLVVFMAYAPPHRCYIPSVDDTNSTIGNRTMDEMLDSAIPWEDDHGELRRSRCYRYDPVLTPGSDHHSSNVTGCTTGWYYDVEAGVSTAVTEFDLVCDREWQRHIMAVVQLAGFAIFSLIGGVLADRYGRWKTFALGNLLRALSVFLIAFAPSPEFILVCMFVQGAAGLVRTISSVVLCTEMFPARWRGTVSVCQLSAACFGYALLPLYAYLIPNWRWMIGAVGGTGLLTIPMLWLVPESVPWLISMNRDDKAKEIIVDIAVFNGVERQAILDHLEKEGANLDSKFDEDDSITDDCETPSVDLSSAKSSSAPRRMSYVDLMKHTVLRTRCFVLTTAWIACVLNYYGISLNTNSLAGNRFLNCFLVAIVELPGDIWCYMMFTRLSPRRLYMISAGVGAAGLLATPFCEKVNTWFGITVAMLSKLAVTASSKVAYVYTGELFPTLLRNQAFGVFQFVCRSVTALLAPIMPMLGEVVHPVFPYVLMSFIGFVSAALVYLMPEIMGRQLPDTLEDAREQEKYRPRCAICCKPHVEDKPIQDENLNML